MPTDDERREVARRLRDEVGCGISWPGMERLGLILGIKRDPRTGWEGRILTRLADLIEPSGHECVPGECPLNVRHDNDRIDRDALLALADRMENMAGRGALLTAHGLAMAAASIREACGEVVG